MVLYMEEYPSTPILLSSTYHLPAYLLTCQPPIGLPATMEHDISKRSGYSDQHEVQALYLLSGSYPRADHRTLLIEIPSTPDVFGITFYMCVLNRVAFCVYYSKWPVYSLPKVSKCPIGQSIILYFPNVLPNDQNLQTITAPG